MDLQQLKAFVAIAECDGVTRAAERLSMSQPAVTRQMQALEASLGVALFRRRGRRVQLTEDGADLLARARLILADVGAFRERATALRSGEAGRIAVGATPPMIEAVLAQFLPAFRESHPAVEIQIVEDGGARLADMAEQGEVTVAYVPAGRDGLTGSLLYPVHVCAAVRSEDPLGRRGPIDIREIAGCPLLVLRRGFGSREWLESACLAAGLQPSILLESASHNAVLALVKGGYGIGILPSALVSRPDGVRLVPLLDRDRPLGRWTMLAWSPRRSLPPYAGAFVRELVAFARHRFPGREVVEKAPAIRRPDSD